jgi:hypothetical protein
MMYVFLRFQAEKTCAGSLSVLVKLGIVDEERRVRFIYGHASHERHAMVCTSVSMHLCGMMSSFRFERGGAEA